MLIFPFLDAVVTLLADTTGWARVGVRRGEAPLQAMVNQLKHLPFYDEESHCYLADGIIKLHELKELEVLLLEASSSFETLTGQKYHLTITKVSLEHFRC
jgi:hypothetical protein